MEVSHLSHLIAVGLVILVLELQLGNRRGDGGDVPVRSIFQNDAIHLRQKRTSLIENRHAECINF